MKAVKKSLLGCSFCGAKIIEIRESVAMRMGQKIKKLLVTDGFLVISSMSSKLPVCSNCWHLAAEYLKKNHDPLGKLITK